MYRLSRGRWGLWPPKPGGWGTMLLTTTGRRSGQERQVILGYIEDGPNVVTMAMNGWGPGEPAWWLNLKANPEARLQLPRESRVVVAHAAEGDERARLWAMWGETNEHLDEYAALRPTETAVVVLEPTEGR
jgi:deazaflavin-dependent oxidoreductase (nitroreductase family)